MRFWPRKQKRGKTWPWTAGDEEAARTYSLVAGQEATAGFCRAYQETVGEDPPAVIRDVRRMFELNYRECSRLSFLAGAMFARGAKVQAILDGADEPPH